MVGTATVYLRFVDGRAEIDEAGLSNVTLEEPSRDELAFQVPLLDFMKNDG